MPHRSPLRALTSRAAAVAGALLVGACSATGVLSGLTSAGGAAVFTDVAYGETARARLDIYAPPRTGVPAPVIVFLYGGSWQMGDKSMYRFVGKALAARGYIVVIPDYRVFPAVKYPDFLRDNARAVRWVRDHAAAYGGDPARLFLMGHSAGAYNAAMLSLDDRWLAAEGLDPARDIRATVGLSGPYDFLPLQDDTLKVIFGPRDDRPKTQPVAYVEGDEPPMFLAHGLKDDKVRPANATRLADRIRKAGGKVEVKFYPRLNHPLTIGVFAGPLRGLAPVMDDSLAFLRAHDVGEPGPRAAR